MPTPPTVHLIDDDASVRAVLARALGDAGHEVRAYERAEAFLAAAGGAAPGCVVTDVRLPGLEGVELIQSMRAKGLRHPIVVITGFADVELAVQALKAGAVDFLQKPLRPSDLIAAVQAALSRPSAMLPGALDPQACRQRLGQLSSRQREVLMRVVAGKLNKSIAYDLGLSVRTVEG